MVTWYNIQIDSALTMPVIFLRRYSVYCARFESIYKTQEYATLGSEWYRCRLCCRAKYIRSTSGSSASGVQASV